jgi:hypothetical protein
VLAVGLLLDESGDFRIDVGEGPCHLFLHRGTLQFIMRGWGLRLPSMAS